MKILVINAGSSSHKAALFDTQVGAAPQWQAQLDWTAQPGQVSLTAQATDGRSHQTTLATADRTTGLRALLATLWSGPVQVIPNPAAIEAVGHRVVHGGDRHQASVRITPAVKATIRDLIPLAPAHNPANLEGIEVAASLLPQVPQVAVFDTAFHSAMPPAAAAYPGPHDWWTQGIRRYGFHGISHRYVAQRAATLMGQPLADLKLVTCHLGNGCSLAAVAAGHSIDTTMGFTPLEGLMMGSRSGSVDPGLILHLLRQGDLTVDQLDQMLNKASGLKGISGVSNDLRAVQAAADAGDGRAQRAIAMFLHSLRRHIGAMVASLGGLDALVFTAGIGENSAFVWRETCEPLGFLGIHLQSKLERCPEDQDIAAAASPVRVWVIHTREEWAIAQDCQAIVTGS
ncbi:MAG: acetate kinase [Cyanobacteria bacterium]|nr:acetate kinase [Cyanobacteriota bacterium]